MEEHVGSVRPVGQIADLIDHQNVRVGIGRERLLEVPSLAGVREVLDQFRCGGEERHEAVLDGSVPDGRQTGYLALPATARRARISGIRNARFFGTDSAEQIHQAAPAPAAPNVCACDCSTSTHIIVYVDIVPREGTNDVHNKYSGERAGGIRFSFIHRQSEKRSISAVVVYPE
jgi:hypothetical protein